MSVVKWILITVGALVLLLVAVGIGGSFYLFNGPSVELSATDMEIGSAWSPTERRTFVMGCMKRVDNAKKAVAACECIAREAETKTSRAVRLLLSATFEGDYRQMAKVAVAAGKVAAKTGTTVNEIDGKEMGDRMVRACSKLG
jgi:hypothetical protein